MSLLTDLRSTLGRENVLSAPSELAVYDCDAFTIERHPPDAVVLPRSTRQVAEVVKLCQCYGASLIARGAGTGLVGGCSPTSSGVVISLSRMNKILEIDLRNRMAVVEAGALNLQLTQALASTGYHFAPDPSSQGASTIGGNVATNAGGPHTLKYGVTVNHVLGLEAVLSDGAVLQLGPVEDTAGLDLIGLLVGSEGTLAIVTKVWVRLTPNPQHHRAMRAIFTSVDDASNAVSQIIAAGIVPAAMELMDQGILAAVEEAYYFGFPPDAGAVLIIEVDGPAAGLDRQQEQIAEFCRRFGAREVLQAASDQERELLWKCRKMAVGATGRLSPSYTIQDGVVPRTRLPHIIRRTAEIGQKHQIRIINVAHAGDGNIHPILLFDERDRGQVDRAVMAGREILEECIAVGGSITAEHGIGVEKLGLMNRLFTPADLEAMRRVRQAFDPTGRLNPGKLIPDKAKLSPLPLGEGQGVRAANSGQWSVASGQCNAASNESNPQSLIPHPPSTSPHPSPLPEGEETRFNRVIDYPAADLTITVDAGMTVAELNNILAKQRQRLPVDVPQPDRTTVGEAVAVNAGGPRRYAYGTMRDYVLGFTAVDGSGRTFSGGGRVVKNAAGYNMCRLMAGSRGTLGILTQATLMVRPQCEASALLACDLHDFDLAEKLLAGLVCSPVRPVAIELLAGRPREGNPVLGPRLEGCVARLYVGFEGSSPEMDWMTAQIRAEWIAAGITTPILASVPAAEQQWNWLAEAPSDVQINVLPSKAIETVVEMLKLAPNCTIQAHAGDGVILTNSRELTAPGMCVPLQNALPGDHQPAIRIMQALKDRFNPERLAAAGTAAPISA